MATAPLTLEEVLAKIAADDDLTTVTIGRMPVGDRVVYTANVHWEGFSRSHQCASGSSEISIRHAVEAALTEATVCRQPQHTVPPVIPAFEVAA